MSLARRFAPLANVQKIILCTLQGGSLSLPLYWTSSDVLGKVVLSKSHRASCDVLGNVVRSKLYRTSSNVLGKVVRSKLYRTSTNLPGNVVRSKLYRTSCDVLGKVVCSICLCTERHLASLEQWFALFATERIVYISHRLVAFSLTLNNFLISYIWIHSC